MKKHLILISMLALLAGGAMAQDTLLMSGPKPDYMSPSWFDVPGKMTWNINHYPISMASEFCNTEELQIYGIAAIILSFPELIAMAGVDYSPSSYPNVVDTSMANVGGYLRLYDLEDGTLVQRGEELYVNKQLTPVSYYLRFNFDTLFHLFMDLSNPAGDYVFPVYERYFTKMDMMVTDTFFVGLTDPMFDTISDSVAWSHYAASCPMFSDFSHNDFDKPGIANQLKSHAWNILRPTNAVYYIFPILTPGENLPDLTDTTIVDTTIVDTTIVDTVGIADVQLVGRYVALQPNPASERVRVTSSFGLQRIEIYNAAGARVREERASGYTATLDLSTLPEGAYLVRVHTPAGSTTKKLVVQRR
jgi:hypothetical protein